MIYRSLFLSLTLTLPCCLTAAQDAPTFAGTNLPLTVQASELGADYRPLKLKEQSSGVFGDYYSSYAFQLSSLGLSSRAENRRMEQLFEILPVAWTRSETVRVYAQDFVVTYILEPSLDDLRAFSEGKPLKSTRLKLKLMKADQIGSIEPFPELNREKYLGILTRLSQKGEAAMSHAKRTQALSNVKQAATAILIYLPEHDDVMPYVHSVKTMQRVTRPYMKNDDVWQTLNPRSAGTFSLNMSLSGVSATAIEEPSRTPMLYDPVAWPDGTRTVAFADGSAKIVSPEAWKGMQKYLNLKLKRRGKPIQ